jgi:formylglycine-generating enzyme required for sulfatase activity
LQRKAMVLLVAAVSIAVVMGLVGFVWQEPARAVLQSLSETLADQLPHAIGVVLAAALVAVFSVVARQQISRRSKVAAEQRVVALLIGYLQRVARNSSNLAFGDPTRTSMDAQSVAGIITLEQVWTPLRVSGQWPQHDERYQRGPQERLPSEIDEELIATVVDRIGSRRLLLLGDPGSGKSSTIAYLASDRARRAISELSESASRLDSIPLPVRVFLADVIPSNQPTTSDLWKGVPELPDNSGDRDEVIRVLEAAMKAGRCLVLLDGLDEVDEAKLPGVRDAISSLGVVYPGAPVLVSCRAYDYFQTVPLRSVPVDQILRLLPYRYDPDMRQYVHRWYEAVVAAGRLARETAQVREDNLLRQLKTNSELEELARTPLLLTLLTLVHTEEGELPASRALVYQRAIRYMLAETAQWRRQSGGATVASAEIMTLAEHVAYVAHTKQERASGATGWLTLEELHAVVAGFYGLDQTPPGAAYDVVSAKVNAHLSRLIQSNGLLLDHGGRRYDFAHKSFREFLAGQYFAPGSRHQEALNAAKEAHWREAFRLLAGYGAKEGKSLYYLLDLICDLGASDRSAELPAPGRTDRILAGEMLLEIGREGLTAGGQARVLQPTATPGGPDGLWRRIAVSIAGEMEDPRSELTVADRIRAGEALAGLGDPRFSDPAGRLTPARRRMIRLEALPYSLGSPVGTGREDERPRRLFALPTLYVGKHMVTNDEFAAFVADHGYETVEWWSPAEGLRWVTGDPDFLAEIQAEWIRTVTDYHAKELRDKILGEDLEREARERCQPRGRPFYWEDARYGRANQPVVGVNWWEARAYCTWLGARGHKEGWLEAELEFRLPTEVEWERAARGGTSDGVYPWGDEWDNDKSHTREDGLGINEAVAVGCYPGGTYLGGPLDMSGNVWEWLNDRKLPYDGAYDVERSNPSGLGDRAIRGSSWYNTPDFARCASRFVDRPYNVYFDLGFRVVCASIGADDVWRSSEHQQPAREPS